MRSLVSPALGRSRPPPIPPAALRSTLQVTLQSTAAWAQYQTWKAADRARRLSDFLSLFLPLLLLLILAFSLHLGLPPWRGGLASALALFALLAFVGLQAVVPLLHVRALIALPSAPLSLRRLRTMWSAVDVGLLGLHVTLALVAVQLLYWAEGAGETPQSSTCRAIVRWGLLLSPFPLLAFHAYARPRLSFSVQQAVSSAWPFFAQARRLLPAVVADAGVAAVAYCAGVVVVVTAWRWAVGPVLGWLLGRVLVEPEQRGTWAGLMAGLLALLKAVLLLLLCEGLSLRLLAGILAQPVSFPLPYALLAMYDSGDRLYHRLGVAYMVALLSPGNRSRLFCPLAALFPDVATLAPSLSGLTVVDAVAVAALQPLMAVAGFLHGRALRLRRRQTEAQQMLQAAGGVVEETALTEEVHREVGLDLNELVGWVQVVGGLLEGVAEDRLRNAGLVPRAADVDAAGAASGDERVEGGGGGEKGCGLGGGLGGVRGSGGDGVQANGAGGEGEDGRHRAACQAP